MRKWQDLAAPDDPGSWYDVGNMWPTKRGTYETADFSTGTDKTAASSAFIKYAFVGRTLSGSREFVVDSGKIWEYSGGSLTDRTNGVSIGSTPPMMAQYGDVTICVMGVATATVVSTSTTFAALAGSPKGEIIVVQSNAVLIFNTDTSADGWAVSDVGDYTNWTTGESASGRIIATPGPITAAVAYGGDVFVFKKDAIYRMSYVGGAIKWIVSLVWKGQGAGGEDFGSNAKYQIVATTHGIVFNGDTLSSTNLNNAVYLFDGSSQPFLLNPLTTLNACYPIYCYHPIEDVLILAPAWGSSSAGTVLTSNGAIASKYYYYSFLTQQWGSGSGSDAEDMETGTTFPSNLGRGVLQGDFYARAETSIKPVYWRYKNVTTGIHTRCAPSAPGSGSACYLQTSKDGSNDFKTLWKGLTPRLRRRTVLGTDSAVLTVTAYRELEDTSATVTISNQAEATQGHKMFDFTVSENFARFKVLWTALDVEVEDFRIIRQGAGKK